MDLFRPLFTSLAITLAWPGSVFGGISPGSETIVRDQTMGSGFESLKVRSFYRSQYPAYSNDHAATPSANRAWGIQMASALPLDGVRASLEYTMTAVPDNHLGETGQTTSFTAGDNHFLQLRLDSQWQDLRYGMRYFTAGENFDRVGLGRDLLHQAGVASATNGTEVWADMRVADIEFKPSARRQVQQQAGGQLIDSEFALLAARPLAMDTRLEYHYRASTQIAEQPIVPGIGGSGPATSSDAATSRVSQTTLRLTHPYWRLNWDNHTRTRHHAELASYETGQQISGALRVLDEFTLAPSLSRHTSVAGSAEINQASSAALRLGYQPTERYTPQINLTLQYQQRAGLLENERDMRADLGVTKRIRLPGAAAAQTSVSASLSFQRSEDTLNGAREDHMGVVFTFEHTVGG